MITVPDVITMEANSTFYFFDENGTLTSLIVHENDQNYSFLANLEDTLDENQCSDNLVQTSMAVNESLVKDELPSTINPPAAAPKKTYQEISEDFNENEENVPPSKTVTPSASKRCRWDHGFPKLQDKSTTFKIPPRMTDLHPATGIPEKRKRKTTNRTQECAELTSSPHRKQVKQAQALKDIKNIKKKPGRKRKSKGDSKQEDALCPTCGSSFSSSLNGAGWKRCIKCTEWFHAECQCSIADSLTCYICI